MPLTKADKHAIVEATRTQRASLVAAAHGITRARVHQLMKEDPETWMDIPPASRGREKAECLRFSKANAHLNDPGLQKQIAASEKNNGWLAEENNTSSYAIRRIRLHWTKKVRKFGEGLRKPSPPKTEGEKALAKEKLRAQQRASQKRLRRENPERVRALDRASYQRHKATVLASNRRYYERNREKVYQRNLAWKRANPERVKLHRKNAARKAKERRAADLTPSPAQVR